MRPKVYIDGHVGTTGLRIREWLARRTDLELLTLVEERRKDDAARRDALLAADVAILCLPDDAAHQVTGWVEAGATRLIDASTAHRVADGWTFGLPELAAEQRGSIRRARFVANPGCYSSAFILLLRPLVDAGAVPRDAPLAIHALSGYSGGGRPMIEKWEAANGGLSTLPFEAPYALERVHKHVPEMIRHTGLAREPYFVPAVGSFRCGMRVEVPLPAGLLPAGSDARTVWGTLDGRYRDEPFIRVVPFEEKPPSGELAYDPRACNDTNRIDLRVLPHPSGHVLLMAILDNLGKGAAGVAIQNLNLMLGMEEERGLRPFAEDRNSSRKDAETQRRA
jgi:N-acetyl-gamma-glutamyl-phosphate reductase